jgi:LacI family transcriptional regulator, galactose operon repressor
MSLTMRRLAEELGVSITTVSKVLNNQPDIGEATRKRVLAKVAELGYRRNAVARSLTLRRTHTLGVIVPDLMHSFFVEIVTAVEALISSRGYGLLVANLAEDPAKERVHLEMLLERQVDGVILASSTGTSNSDLLRRIGTLGKGLVFIDRDDHPKIKCHRVLTDDVEVGRLATEHLIGLGHKAIAHISAQPLVHAMRREEGYREAMAKHGLKIQPQWIVPGGFLQDQGYEAMQRLLKLSPEVTAVFAVNDPAAIGALKAAWEAGVRVPEDITIVGAGDIAHGDMLRVPLTTVSWSRRDLGTTAAKLILDQLEGHPAGPVERVIIPPKLIVRSSCGPPRRTRS